MTFSLSATVITQMHEDSDLSGLGNIPGVVVQQSGTGNSVFTAYFLGNKKVNILGTLTIDPTKEVLICGVAEYNRTLEIFGTGTLNLGRNIEFEDGDYQTPGVAIIMTNNNLSACCSGQAFNIRKRGRLNWNGATLISNASIRWEARARVNIKNAKIIGNRGSLCNISNHSSLTNIDGLELVNDVCIDFHIPPFKCTNLDIKNSEKGLQILHTEEPRSITPYIIHNYNSIGVTKDLCVSNGANLELINTKKSVELSNIITDNELSVIQYFKEFKLSAYDTSNNPIEGAKYYFTDTDNGSRFDIEPRNTNIRYHFLQTKIYSQVSDNLGVFPPERILTEVDYITEVDSDVIKDFRGIKNSYKAFFNINLISYLHNYALLTRPMSGCDINDLSISLSEDNLITEKDITVVSNYDKIDTAEKFYDKAKEYLFNNYTGEKNTLVTRSDNTVYAGSYNIIIDDSADTVFSIDNNNINIKSDVFDGNIITTGQITFPNNFNIEGFYQDSSGISSFITIK